MKKTFRISPRRKWGDEGTRRGSFFSRFFSFSLWLLLGQRLHTFPDPIKVQSTLLAKAGAVAMTTAAAVALAAIPATVMLVTPLATRQMQALGLELLPLTMQLQLELAASQAMRSSCPSLSSQTVSLRATSRTATSTEYTRFNRRTRPSAREPQPCAAG